MLYKSLRIFIFGPVKEESVTFFAIVRSLNRSTRKIDIDLIGQYRKCW